MVAHTALKVREHIGHYYSNGKSIEVEHFGSFPDFFAQSLTQMPPVLILHGQADVLVSVQEAHRLERLLRDRNLPYEIKIYPGQGHTFTPDIQEDVLRRGLAFLERHLK